MTDEQFNNLLAFITRNRDHIFKDLGQAKRERDEAQRGLLERCQKLAAKNEELKKIKEALKEIDAER